MDSRSVSLAAVSAVDVKRHYIRFGGRKLTSFLLEIPCMHGVYNSYICLVSWSVFFGLALVTGDNLRMSAIVYKFLSGDLKFRLLRF